MAQLGGVGEAFEKTSNGKYYKYVFKHIPGFLERNEEGERSSRIKSKYLHGKKIYLAPGEDPAHWTPDRKNPVGQGRLDYWSSEGRTAAWKSENLNAEIRGGIARIQLSVARVVYSAVFPNRLSHGTMERKSFNLFFCCVCCLFVNCNNSHFWGFFFSS